MRKVWIGALALGAVGVGAVVLLPILFKDRLIGLVIEQVNQRVDATVALGDVSVSALSSFPDLTITVADLLVTGRGAFDGVTLAKAGTLKATVDLGSLMGDGPAVVEQFQLSNGALNLITDAEGRSNTDIAPAPEGGVAAPKPAATEEAPSTLSLKLKDYRIEHMDVLYDDQQGGTREQKEFIERDHVVSLNA